jgi:hypothetical protein
MKSMDPSGHPSIGAIQRRLACSQRMDDTYKSRKYQLFITATREKTFPDDLRKLPHL